MSRCAFIVVLAILLAVSPAAFAQEAAAAGAAPAFDALDTFWIIFAAVLVFFMQAGFGLVEAGMVRAKNAGNILMKNLMDFSLAALAFLAVGYAVMWGDGNGFIGAEGWFLIGVESPVEGVEPDSFPPTGQSQSGASPSEAPRIEWEQTAADVATPPSAMATGPAPLAGERHRPYGSGGLSVFLGVGVGQRRLANGSTDGMEYEEAQEPGDDADLRHSCQRIGCGGGAGRPPRLSRP